MLEVLSSHLDGCSAGVISFKYLMNGEEIKAVQFNVPSDFTISGDLAAAVAIAIRPLDSRSICFNFPVSSRAREIVAKDYLMEVKAPDGIEPLIRPIENSFLNFSGGVDSLAAQKLLGSRVRLLSIDFGGGFAREAEWFREWDTFVVETNFRNKPFNENLDWRFMAAGTLLFAEYLHIGSVYWGSVLEASPYWFSNQRKKAVEETVSTHVFGIANLRMCQAVTPLSEYGTMKIAATTGAETLERSLVSCANPKSEKYFRKMLLRSIATGEQLSTEVLRATAPQRKYAFRSSFGVDVLTAYFCWSLGIDFVREYLAEISDENAKELSNLDMRFFEKYNPANVPALPAAAQKEILGGYEECGLKPYDAIDVESLDKCRILMARYHGFK